MLKSLNDTLSDVSSETMVTSDSGRGGSEEDVHLKSIAPGKKQNFVMVCNASR